MRNLMILAKWLAAQADVDVVASNTATTARICLLSTGKKQIQIPSKWCTCADLETTQLLEGIIDHEALGHGRFTDFESDDVAKAKGYDMTELAKSICNILEDVMIERRAIDTYPGVKANLVRTVEILNRKGFFGKKDEYAQAKPSSLMLAGLVNCLRGACIPGQDQILQGNMNILHEMLDEQFGDVWKTIFELALQVKDSKTSMDNWDLTQKIMETLKSESEKEISSNQDQQGDQSQSDSSKDDSQGDDDSGEKQDQDRSDDQSGSDKDSESKSATESDKTDDVDDESQDGNDSGSGQDQQDAGQPSKNSGQGSASAQNAQQPNSSKSKSSGAAGAVLNDSDVQVDMDISTVIGQAIDADTDSFDDTPISIRTTLPAIRLSPAQKRIASQVNAVADDLKEALIEQTQSGKFNKLVGKRLNSRIVSRVKTGNPRIFQSKTEADGVAAAVSILIDTSGSMCACMSDGASRFVGSVGVAKGIADVLAEFDVPFEIAFYDDVYMAKKEFDDDWNSVSKNQMYPIPNNGTQTGAAMQKALSELILRHEARRLLIVITDGDTSDHTLLESCYTEAKVAGIEVASLMLGDEIPAIERLSKFLGFNVATHNSCDGIAKYVVKTVLATI